MPPYDKSKSWSEVLGKEWSDSDDSRYFTVASTMSILLIYEFVKLIIFNIWGIVNLLVLV